MELLSTFVGKFFGAFAGGLSWQTVLGILGFISTALGVWLTYRSKRFELTVRQREADTQSVTQIRVAESQQAPGLIGEAFERIERLETEYDRLLRENTELRIEMSRLKSRSDDAIEQLKRKEREAQGLYEEKERLERELSDSLARIAELEDRVGTLERTLNNGT